VEYEGAEVCGIVPTPAGEEFNEDQGEFFGQLKEDDFVP
jgi:hypothetical protein